MSQSLIKRLAGLVLLLFLLSVTILIAPTPQPVEAQTIGWPQPPYFPTNVSFSGTSATLVSAPSAGGVCVYSLSLINAGASAITVNVYQDGGTTSVSSVYLAGSGGAAFWPMATGPKTPWFITNAGSGFVVKTSAGVQVNGSIYAATCP
jgi:hypothetical protein